MKSRLWPWHAGARAYAGFTLIEMLIAIVIVGILTVVVLPGYQYAVLKSTRAAARLALIDVASRQQQFFVNHKRYATQLDELGLPVAYYIDARGEPVPMAAASYRIQLALESAIFSGVTAAPLNKQTADLACMTFSLSAVGVRSVSGRHSAEPAECW